ncbi:YaaC family protein [Aquimarina sp. D1M17]|uniref:YaaC family protein n=1 Tax=Aquimarina acroporae TaxID=2937283 RepID=UPI0020C0E577|nr:YaaC family protein [Aquimarina acroporae]MCK8523879.1 YaaC family protein [Aquimarina acroporae]
MTELKEKYGFPLFTKETNLVYLGHERKLIISDVWAFWDYVIKKKNTDKKFLLSLLEQAKNFYNAAENAPLNTKPLLFYYSFLNLAKIVLNLEYNYGQHINYLHGISERNNNTFHKSGVTLQPIETSKIKVASELYRLFNGVTIETNTTINLKNLLSHCVGIHRAYSEIYRKNEAFCKLSKTEYFKNGKEIGIKAKIQCDGRDISSLKKLGYNIEKIDGIPYLIETLQTDRYSPAREDYYMLSQQILNKGIWYYVGDSGYNMYVSKQKQHRYPTEMIIYCTIFYLGSITRYRPNLFKEIFNDMEQWLMSEFLTTQPKQFLYLTTAKMLGQKVLKAYTSF